MKVLVTGANGFLGTWLVNRLLEQGDEVSVLLRKPDASENYEQRGVRVFLGDVTDPDSLIAAVKDQKKIFHLAGLVAYTRRDREAMMKINALGTENLLTVACRSRVQRLELVSSVVAVGATFAPEVLNEESPFTLQNYHLGYHESKREAEAILRRFVKEEKIDGVIVNPSTVYGAGDASKSSRSTQLNVAQGKMLFYPPGGVSVVAVEDVIEGMILAMERGRSGERYILAGENLSLQEVFSRIADVAGVKPPKFPVPASMLLGLAKLDESLSRWGLSGPLPSERALVALMYHWYDSGKAKKELGYSTRPAQQAIVNSVSWMSKQGLLRKK